MADASVVVTAGSGTNLHSDTRTYSGSTKHDQYVLPAEYNLATYKVIAQGVSVATANDHILQIMAGASLNVRLRRFRIEQSANATTVGAKNVELWRLSTAGTGGTAATPRPRNTASSV